MTQKDCQGDLTRCPASIRNRADPGKSCGDDLKDWAVTPLLRGFIGLVQGT
jgi:hypothetical protein